MMLNVIVSEILDSLPQDIPTSELLEALSMVTSAIMIEASGEDLPFRELLLQTVQSDLRSKVEGVS